MIQDLVRVQGHGTDYAVSPPPFPRESGPHHRRRFPCRQVVMPYPCPIPRPLVARHTPDQALNDPPVRACTLLHRLPPLRRHPRPPRLRPLHRPLPALLPLDPPPH